jgi:hypothetical protein
MIEVNDFNGKPEVLRIAELAAIKWMAGFT